MRLPLYDGEHGARCRREDYKSDRARHTTAPSCLFVLLFRRRQNAGGHCIADADGKDFCGDQETRRCGTAVLFYSDGSHDRRRDGKLCDARRCDYGRAGGADRLCGTQSHQTDHRTGASRRLSDFGISGGARICGRHCAARESQKDNSFPDQVPSGNRKADLCRILSQHRFSL